MFAPNDNSNDDTILLSSGFLFKNHFVLVKREMMIPSVIIISASAINDNALGSKSYLPTIINHFEKIQNKVKFRIKRTGKIRLNLVVRRDNTIETHNASNVSITKAPIHKYRGNISISESDNTIGFAYAEKVQTKDVIIKIVLK